MFWDTTEFSRHPRRRKLRRVAALEMRRRQTALAKRPAIREREVGTGFRVRG